MKTISKYIPVQPELTSITVRLDRKLKLRVEKILRSQSDFRRKIGWQTLIEACLKKFCDEESRSKS